MMAGEKGKAMYKITLSKADLFFDMPNDANLGLFDACDRVEIYKRKNPSAVFSVVNMENGDIEYQV